MAPREPPSLLRLAGAVAEGHPAPLPTLNQPLGEPEPGLGLPERGWLRH